MRRCYNTHKRSYKLSMGSMRASPIVLKFGALVERNWKQGCRFMKGESYTTTINLVVLMTHMMTFTDMSTHKGPGEKEVKGSMSVVR